MVSNFQISMMFVSVIFPFLLFAGFILYYRRKQGVSVLPIVLGAVGFIVLTQILEKILHIIVIGAFPNYAEHPWLFGIYGGLAAGSFEELGRFAIFVWLLKKYRDYKDGVSFGIGWGGIEAVLLLVVPAITNIMFAFMINAGTFEASVAAQIPADQLATVKDNVINTGAGLYLFGMLERFFAVFMQIAFSILVLLAVVKKRFSLVLLALFIHAFIDFPLVFYQTGYIKQLWIIEAYLAVIGVLGVVFIRKSKKWFA